MKRLVLALLFLATCAHAAPLPPTPAELYGELFQRVQQEHVFADGKTFVDAVARRAPEAIMADYARQPPKSKDELAAFVAANFDLPPTLSAPTPETDRPPLRTHIAGLWPQLRRPALIAPPGSSALDLPKPYVVPGGRFREIYYWDSYFTSLGLRADGHGDWADELLDDFDSLVERYGRIPNGTRTYYLSRSQPPFYAMMADLSTDRSPATVARRLKTMLAEHDFWMSGSRAVTMPDGSMLNRYWDDRDTPRDESWAEDVATAAGSDRASPLVYRDLRAAAESGWDFSSRWLDDDGQLASIHTSDIVPVDLNSLLWCEEMEIAKFYLLSGDRAAEADYRARAQARKAAINRYLWIEDEGRYADYSLSARHATPVISAATVYPLAIALATPDQAYRVALTVEKHLLGPGGLRTTEIRTGQQWDAPNGWAPLQWMAVTGLAFNGYGGLAHEIARRWVATVDTQYRASGKMLEKYDVEESLPGGGGEYPLQDGFGWTNGVTAALIDMYPDLDPDAGKALP